METIFYIPRQSLYSYIKVFILKTFILSLFFFFSSFFNFFIYSQPITSEPDSSSTSLTFNTAVFPWIVITSNQDKHSFYKKELDSSLEKLSSLFQKTIPQDSLPSTLNSINIKKQLSQIKLGTAISSSYSDLIVQPIWVNTLQSDFIFLAVFDFNNTLIYLDHIKTQLPYSTSLKNKTSSQDLSSPISFLFNKMNQSINSYKNKFRSFLKLKINTSTTTNLPSSLLTLLLEEYFISNYSYKIIRSSSLKQIDLIHKLKNTSLRNRANRTISTYWNKSSSSNSVSTSTTASKSRTNTLTSKDFPISFEFKYNISESIFSSSIKPEEPQQTLPSEIQILELSSSNPSYKKLSIVSLPQSFISTLSLQEKELSNTTPAKVVKISKSWAYLDKGRSQGLKLHDRFISDTDPSIQGHIVSYYGSELNLKSDQGYPISEGAILFIRKGQSKLKIGQKFKKDPTQYPSSLKFK